MTVRILEEGQLYREAAILIADSIGSAVRASGRAMVALSGGKTPATVYRTLALEYLDSLEWDKVHVFFSDERCVPPDDPESNYRMAYESLISRVAIQGANVHRMKGEIEPSAAAEDYSSEIRAVVSGGPCPETGSMPRSHPPCFDLILLGMGEDGHTASIFPGSEVVKERAALVAAPFVPKLDVHRLTLTPPMIQHAWRIIVLTTGEAKSEALAQAINGPYDPNVYPAQIVREAKGDVIWMVNPAAAERLRNPRTQP
jgi:6-phosphogluconolactonase